MKIKTAIVIILVLTLSSCYKPGKIQIQNNVSGVELTEIYWGDVYITYRLLPGQTSGEISIDDYQYKLPAKNRVSFIMKANDMSVYLETEDEYLLNEDERILIVIDDASRVRNPNE